MNVQNLLHTTPYTFHNNDKPKVLIVDDDQLSLMALTKILTPQYNVMIAADGISAINAAEKQPPDIILLDIIMPKLNGYEVLSQLKEANITKYIPVIFITSLDRVEDEEKGLNLGAADYITKPFHSSIVRVRIKTHLKLAQYIRTIERLCMIDMLTELPNRNGFAQRAQLEWAHARRDKTPLAFLMIDVDHFKQYNDTYGHPEGDVLLQTLSASFRESLYRATDFIARWGGEEFVALLPKTNIDEAFAIGERIRRQVEMLTIPIAHKPGETTSAAVSIGVYANIPANDETVDDFISSADKALYKAKNEGRNRVCCYEI